MNNKGGITKKKYYCKECNKKIRFTTALYGSGLCGSCARRKMWKTNKIKRRKINYCIDCGNKLSNKPNANRCKSCASKYRFRNPKDCPGYIDGRCKNKRKYMNNYNKIRKKKDINYKLRTYLSSIISKVLKIKKKTQHTIKLLGCSIPKLKQHLEKQFAKGMNWDNHNPKGWHVDHIRPCCSFDLSKESEQKKCFHYTNLQPLWAIDNLKKGRKWKNNSIIKQF